MNKHQLHSLLAAWSAFVCSTASGQSAAAVTADSETVQLSPFTVSTDTDKGYAATETLAGTRMRTNLKDIGAPLTVLTPEFMQDLAVNSLDQALLYTASVDPDEGQLGTPGTNVRFGTGQSFTIRGFNTNTGEQSISHDFFTALDPTDNYNTERTTLALGPNALLIGVGNPQGTAITSTKRAQMQKQRTQVQLQSDTNGSHRVSIDYNQPLIEGKLALRVNLLHDAKREFRRYEGRNQERATIGITAKPFANTTITLNHESYTVNVNDGSLRWGYDANIAKWAALGKPSVDFLPNGQLWTTARSYVDAAGKRIPVAAGAVDANKDGFVDSQPEFDPKSDLSVSNAQLSVWFVGLGLANPMINTRYMGSLTTANFGGTAGGNYSTQKPWEVLGISQTAFLNGGTWDRPAHPFHGRWTQLSIEQKLAENLYLELGANLAAQGNTLDNAFFVTGLSIDPNRYLPDGSPNPGYLVPYGSASSQIRKITRDYKEYRASLSYQLDLTKRNRWLGDHSFSGLYQYNHNEDAQDLLKTYNVGAVGFLNGTNGWANDITSATTGANTTRVYFKDGNVPIMPSTSEVFANKALLDSYGHLVGGTPNERAPIDISLQTFGNSLRSKLLSETYSFGWQARWLRNRLVTLAGYRKDSTRTYGIPTGVRTVVNPDIPNAATTPLFQTYNSALSIPFNSVPSVVAKGISRTYGGVFHVTDWVSLTYNCSANFLPVTDASWITAQGKAAPNSLGKTQESGARFSLFKGNLSVGFTKFVTSADNQARGAGTYVNNARNILTQLRTFKDAGDPYFADLAGPNILPVDLNIADTYSFKAKGYEMSLVFNPSRNWRMALSGSSNANVQSASLPGIGAYLATNTKYEGLATWANFAKELRKVEAGQASSIFNLNPNDATARALAGTQATLLETRVTAQAKSYGDQQALVGISTSPSGKYALNTLVTRVFNEGRLKGFELGGNARWRSPNTIGYLRTPDPTTGVLGLWDANRPMHGKEYWDIGAMISYGTQIAHKTNVRVQLNIQNLPNWRAPRQVGADSDTQGIYGPINSIVPTMWEVRRPRNYVLTTTFEF